MVAQRPFSARSPQPISKDLYVNTCCKGLAYFFFLMESFSHYMCKLWLFSLCLLYRLSQQQPNPVAVKSDVGAHCSRVFAGEGGIFGALCVRGPDASVFLISTSPEPHRQPCPWSQAVLTSASRSRETAAALGPLKEPLSHSQARLGRQSGQLPSGLRVEKIFSFGVILSVVGGRLMQIQHCYICFLRTFSLPPPKYTHQRHAVDHVTSCSLPTSTMATAWRRKSPRLVQALTTFSRRAA